MSHVGFPKVNGRRALLLAVFLPILVLSCSDSKNQEATDDTQELRAAIDTSNANLVVNVRKIEGNFAVGDVAGPEDGYVWYAVKVDGQWQKVWSGQNIISCSPVQQYSIPKTIYGECSQSY